MLFGVDFTKVECTRYGRFKKNQWYMKVNDPRLIYQQFVQSWTILMKFEV